MISTDKILQTVLFICVQSGNSTFFDIKKKNVHKHWKRNKPKVTKGLIKLINALIKNNFKKLDADKSVWTAYCSQPFYKLKSQRSIQSSMYCLLFTTFVVYKLKSQASMGIVQVIWLLHNVFTFASQYITGVWSPHMSWCCKCTNKYI